MTPREGGMLRPRRMRRRPKNHRIRTVRRDHRPYFLKRAALRLEDRYTEHFLRPQLEHLGAGHRFMKPWNLRLHGPDIRIGEHVHVVTAGDRRVCLSVWEHKAQRGRIDVGDFALLCPGVRIDSAASVSVGPSSMIAAGAYVTDADWHDLYDRTRLIGTARPVTLEENVWIGDGATVCKGVTVGAHSVVAAGAVVARDVPSGVVVAGNPARVVKELDPTRERITRRELFADPEGLARWNEELDRWLLADNSLLGWLRARLAPRRGD
jgi:acetyltransferase-like isoleucine patch superfamily enzyme